jgi:hypothetical protein
MPSSSFNAVFKLSSTRTGDIGEFEVLSFHLNMVRPHDADGLPTGKMGAAVLEVEMVISDKEIVIGSVFDANDLVKGKIEFKKIDEASNFRTMSFDKSWIVEYDERFDPSTKSPMVLKLVIAAGKFEVDGVSSQRLWAGKLS